MNTFQDMLPSDMFKYCQDMHLLDSMLEETDAAATLHAAAASSNDFAEL
jgi:hypothetical protein